MKYDLVTHLDVPGHPNETTLRFLPDGEMIALVRREGRQQARLDRPQPAAVQRMDMERDEAPGRRAELHSPARRLALGRRPQLPPGGAKTVVAKMTADGDYEPVLTFPSGGDTSYPGLVWHDGLLVDELLLVARRQDVDLSGQDQGAARSRQRSAHGGSRSSMTT